MSDHRPSLAYLGAMIALAAGCTLMLLGWLAGRAGWPGCG